MPIHGHTKIELTNQTTGEVEVVEKDNLVTNAVAQIFTSFNGGANLRTANAGGEYTGWELPESLYGGLLLYDRALGSDPDTVFAPPEARLVGTGVPRMSNTGNGVLRGSYNKIESNIDIKNGVVTFVYDFATSQANGVIASVCLTHRYGGYFDESAAALAEADGARSGQYQYSGLFDGAKPFPRAPGQSDTTLFGRPLYADPESDEMLFAALDGTNLVLRHVTGLTTELDLFNPVGTSRVKNIETMDISDVMYVKGDGYYTAVGYDADADQIYVVSTECAPLKPTDHIRVRTYDRKTRAAKTYEFANPTGAQLMGGVGGDTPLLRNTGRVLGGCLYVAGYASDVSYSAPKLQTFYKIPLADPSKVESIDNHGLMLPMIHDAHDGKLYYYGSLYAGYGRVLNTVTKEILAMEAFNDADRYPYCCVPVLGCPVAPFMLQYAYPSGEGELRQGIRRNYLATINDLAAPVEKTADKTMKITYTLRKEAE